ncbi:zinc finger protein [Ditylenchus destructor]|uniref:Zinc finger protein n=1 Tax=Ditylenchus destructor TaxID=166010 RepID=A0AAD4N8V9_9BILA|nr:zinc finger protein [Ditylenchus destructor]
MISVEPSAPTDSLPSKTTPSPIPGPTMAASPKVFPQPGEPFHSAHLSALSPPANNTGNSTTTCLSSSPSSNSTVTNSETATSAPTSGPPPASNSLTLGPAAFDDTHTTNGHSVYTGTAGHSQYLAMSINSNKSEPAGFGQSGSVGVNCTTSLATGPLAQVTHHQSYSQPPGVAYTAVVPGPAGQLPMHFPSNISQNSHTTVSNIVVASSTNGHNFVSIPSNLQEMRQDSDFGNCTSANMTWQPNTSAAVNNITMSSQANAKINTQKGPEATGPAVDAPKMVTSVTTATTDRTFPCSACGKLFGSNRNLQRHICKVKKKNALNTSTVTQAAEMKEKLSNASDIKSPPNPSPVTTLPPPIMANNSIGTVLPLLQNPPPNQTQPLPATNASPQETAKFKCEGCDRMLSSSRSLRRHRGACKATKEAISDNNKSAPQVLKSAPPPTFEAEISAKSDERVDQSEANSKVADVVDSVVEKLRQQRSTTKDESPLPPKEYATPAAPTVTLHAQMPQTSVMLSNGHQYHYMQQLAPTHPAPTSISYYPHHHYVAPNYYHHPQQPQVAQMSHPMQVAPPPPQGSQWGPQPRTSIMAPAQVNSIIVPSQIGPKNSQSHANTAMVQPQTHQSIGQYPAALQTNSGIAPNQANSTMNSPPSVAPVRKPTTETQAATATNSTPVQTKTNSCSSGGGGKSVYRHLCPECDKPYSCRKNVKRHRVSVHKVPFEEAQTGPIKKIKLNESPEEAPVETKIQSENAPRQNLGPTTMQPTALGTQTGSKTVSSRPSQMPQNNYIQSPQASAMPPTSAYSQPHTNAMMSSQAPYSAPPALNNSPHAGRPAFTFGPPSEAGYYNGTQNCWNSTPPLSSAAKNQAYPPRWTQNSYDSRQNPPYSAMIPTYIASPPGSQYQSAQFNYRHTSADNGGSQPVMFGSPSANYPDGGFYPATHNLADLDYWDQIKSNVDTPLTSRSRDDDLEMARIVEDLKRSAEGDPRYPAQNDSLLAGNGTFHELQPGTKIDDKSAALNVLSSANQYPCIENAAARKSTELVLAEADTTFWEEDGDKNASRHEALQGNSPPVLTSLKPVMLISSPDKGIPMANTSPVGKANAIFIAHVNPPINAKTVDYTIENFQGSDSPPNKNNYSLKRHRQICQKYKDRQPNQQQEHNTPPTNDTSNSTTNVANNTAQNTTMSPNMIGTLDPDSTSTLWQQNHNRSTESSPPLTAEGSKTKS